MNFSDSIAKKRKAYKSKNRRRRRKDGAGEFGDVDDADDDDDNEQETLERRLARLRREVGELKDEFAARETEKSAERDGKGAHAYAQDGAEDDGVLELSRALDNLHASARGGPQSAATALSQRMATRPVDSDHPVASGGTETGAAPSSTSLSPPTGILTHSAAFDSRLALIEAAMGISTPSNPFIDSAGLSPKPALQPVLPTLDQLSSRLSALISILIGPTPTSAAPTTTPTTTTTFSTPHLEALTSRVRKLTTDAENLELARKRASDAANSTTPPPPPPPASASAPAPAPAPVADDDDPTKPRPQTPATSTDPSVALHNEQTAKIHALYASLPTIQSLHPLLPGVLDRLRSLRAIHAGAAQAAESLDGVERRQTEMMKEVQQWREGLRVVEEKMEQGEASMKSNIEVVEPWVRGLEGRLERLEGST